MDRTSGRRSRRRNQRSDRTGGPELRAQTVSDRPPSSDERDRDALGTGKGDRSTCEASERGRERKEFASFMKLVGMGWDMVGLER